VRRPTAGCGALPNLAQNGEQHAPNLVLIREPFESTQDRQAVCVLAHRVREAPLPVLVQSVGSNSRSRPGSSARPRRHGRHRSSVDADSEADMRSVPSGACRARLT